MKKFLQIHALTVYSLNNLNRDDLGRPKAMLFGGAPRLRVSSQCIKRAYRLSPVMESLMSGLRTKSFFYSLYEKAIAMKEAGDPCIAPEVTSDMVLASILQLKLAYEGGKEPKKLKDKDPRELLVSAVLLYISKAERDMMSTLLFDALAAGQSLAPQPGLVEQLSRLSLSPDVAMFGRMVAGNLALKVEGAVQVAHPFTAHKALAEDDYFTGVDDLTTDGEGGEGGAGHLGALGFGSGVYYHYFNIDLELLVKNLGGDKALAKEVVAAFIEAVATVAPGAKQTSMAARSYASYLAVDAGDAQPVSLAEAFVKPVSGSNMLESAVSAIESLRASLKQAYPDQMPETCVLNRIAGQGDLPATQAFAAEALND